MAFAEAASLRWCHTRNLSGLGTAGHWEGGDRGVS